MDKKVVIEIGQCSLPLMSDVLKVVGDYLKKHYPDNESFVETRNGIHQVFVELPHTAAAQNREG